MSTLQLVQLAAEVYGEAASVYRQVSKTYFFIHPFHVRVVTFIHKRKLQ